MLELASPTVALVVSLLVGAVFILSIGRDPIVVYGRFFHDSLGSTYGIGQILFKATPLIFAGLSAAIGFKAGLFNIGAEGQLTVGAFLTALVGYLLAPLPAILLIPCSLLAGIVGGAVWGAIPGFLKARFGAHEVINTIMMNFIAAGLVSYFVLNVFSVAASVHTPAIGAEANLTRLEAFYGGFRGSPANISLFLAIACAGFAYYFLYRSRPGYEMRTVGANPSAAQYAHISVRRNIVLSMTIAGGIAGLVGSNFVMGYKHYYELGFSEGIGFIGIAVALLANNNPIGIIAAALFFGMLEYGSLTINTIVPKELSNILQAIVILVMIVTSKLLTKTFSRTRSAGNV